MSAPVDSLGIKVDASARNANQQLDKLVQKMVQLRSTVNGINIGNLNKMATSIQNFSKAVTGISQVKTSDFTRMAKNIEKLTNVNSSKLDKSAQSVEKVAGSLKKASSVSNNAISSGLKFDSSGAQNMQKAIQSLSNEYSDVGKGKTFEGTLTELEKQADKLVKKLDDLAEKEEKVLAVGGTSTESKTFKNLQYDIAKTMNQLAELENEIAKIRSAKKQDISSLPIFRSDVPSIGSTDNSGLTEFKEKADSVFKELPETAKYSVERAQQSLQDALKKVRTGDSENSSFRNYTEEIKNLKANLESLEQSGRGVGSDEWDEAYIALHKVNMEVKDYKANLLRPWKEGNEEIQKTASLGNRVEELNAKLKELKANGLNFGDAEYDDVYRNLQRATGELKEYKAILNKPATGMDEEIKKTDSLGNRVEQLKTKLKDLQSNGLNFGDAEYDKTYRELQKSTTALKAYKSNLTQAGSTARSVAKNICDAFRSIWNQTKKVGSGIVSFGNKIKSLTTHFHSMSSSTSGLIGKIMKLYIGFQSLKSVGNAAKNAFDKSAEYIESYNYFDDVFSSIAGKSKSGWKEQGYNNAKSYADSFQNRMKTMLSKMTGYDIGKNGILSYTGTKNLGLDVSEMTQYATSIANLADSIGLAGETSLKTSQAFSMLVGDLGAFRNADNEQVMSNLQSGLTGSAQAMKKYGIDISVATLQQIAYQNGIKKSVSTMTQAEKVQLRTLAILNQSRSAWGYLAKEINTPSNQIRLLKNSFNSLARTIGNIFMPVVAKVLPYINGLVIAIKRLFEWSASLLGIDLSDIMGSAASGSDAFDGLEEDANNASSAVDDTTDSVKKLAKQLMGFDELNVITTNQSSSSSSDSSGDSKPIDLTSQLSSALADYEDVWNKAYKDMTSDAEKFANKLTKLFKDAWISGDGSDIGSAIASWLNQGIKWVNENVDTFAAGLKKIANMLATGVNGFVKELDWDGLGTAIGKSLKAFFDAETHFFDTVNWVNFGSSLATSLNAAIDSGVIQSYFKLIASKLKAGIETAFGAVTTFKFDNLGTAIGQGINDFFDKMGEVNKQTGLNGWQELGVTLTEGISGILESITTALDTVHWEDVGQAIADFISSMNTSKIGWNLGKLVKSLATSFYTLVSDKSTWSELGTKIADGINGFFKGMNEVDSKTGLNGWQTLGKDISESISGITNAITTALEETKWGEIGKAIWEFISNIDFVSMAKDTQKASVALTEAIGEFINGIDWEELGTSIVNDFWDILENTDWEDGAKAPKLIGKVANAIFSLLKGGFEAGYENTSSVISTWLAKIMAKIWTTVETWWNNNVKLPDIKVPSIGDIKEVVTTAWEKVTSWWKTAKSSLAKIVAPAIGSIKAVVSSAWTKVTSWWKTAKSSLANIKVPSIGSIKAVVSSAWTKVTSWWKTAKSSLANIVVPAIGSIKEKVSSAWTTAKTWWTKNVKFPAFKFTTIAKDTVKKWLKPIVDVLNSIIEGFNKLMKLSWKDVKIPGVGKIISKGSFTLLTIPTIKGFKDGGFPEQGQYFLARENGPELVGTVGGKSAVVNNSQIVQSVSDGVFNALAPVLTQVVNSVNALNSKIDNMGSNGVDVEKYKEGDLLKVVRKEDSNYKKRTGKSAFAN